MNKKELYKLCKDTLVKKCYKLQEENKILRGNTDLVNLELIEYKNDLEDRIDKAIEYIETENSIGNEIEYTTKLLDILRGTNE